MYVISLRAWRRKLGPVVRTLVIVAVVLWALLSVYRWFAPALPVMDPTPLRELAAWPAPARAGSGGVYAELPI